MKAFITILILVFCKVFLYGIEANILLYKYKSPASPYIELNLHFTGSSIKYIHLDSTVLQGGIMVTTIFMQNDKIVKADKYTLNTPLSSVPLNFIDVRRYSMAAGNYRLLLHMQDINDTTNVLNSSIDFSLAFENQKTVFSDIQLLSDVRKSDEESVMVKNGFYMEPVSNNYFPKSISNLFSYFELYNVDALHLSNIHIYSYIEQAAKDGIRIKEYDASRSYPSRDILSVILHKNIQKLPSGNYNFIVEVRNEDGLILMDKKVFFQRSNPDLDLATMIVDKESYEQSFVQKLSLDDCQYNLRALAPVLSGDEIVVLNSIIKMDNLDAKRKYLHNYWNGFDPKNPEKSYQLFINLAHQIDAAYASGFGYGFETDRGRIWLKYGPPNDKVSIEEDPNAPPYEIWVYNEFPKTKQRVVKFLFYNPSLGNDFILLHSNCRTEINNPRWLKELYKGAKTNANADDYQENGQVKDSFLKHAADYFNDL